MRNTGFLEKSGFARALYVFFVSYSAVRGHRPRPYVVINRGRELVILHSRTHFGDSGSLRIAQKKKKLENFSQFLPSFSQRKSAAPGGVTLSLPGGSSGRAENFRSSKLPPPACASWFLLFFSLSLSAGSRKNENRDVNNTRMR